MIVSRIERVLNLMYDYEKNLLIWVLCKKLLTIEVGFWKKKLTKWQIMDNNFW